MFFTTLYLELALLCLVHSPAVTTAGGGRRGRGSGAAAATQASALTLNAGFFGVSLVTAFTQGILVAQITVAFLVMLSYVFQLGNSRRRPSKPFIVVWRDAIKSFLAGARKTTRHIAHSPSGAMCAMHAWIRGKRQSLRERRDRRDRPKQQQQEAQEEARLAQVRASRSAPEVRHVPDPRVVGMLALQAPRKLHAMDPQLQRAYGGTDPPPPTRGGRPPQVQIKPTRVRTCHGAPRLDVPQDRRRPQASGVSHVDALRSKRAECRRHGLEYSISDTLAELQIKLDFQKLKRQTSNSDGCRKSSSPPPSPPAPGVERGQAGEEARWTSAAMPGMALAARVPRASKESAMRVVKAPLNRALSSSRGVGKVVKAPLTRAFSSSRVGMDALLQRGSSMRDKLPLVRSSSSRLGMDIKQVRRSSGVRFAVVALAASRQKKHLDLQLRGPVERMVRTALAWIFHFAVCVLLLFYALILSLKFGDSETVPLFGAWGAAFLWSSALLEPIVICFITVLPSVANEETRFGRCCLRIKWCWDEVLSP